MCFGGNLLTFFNSNHAGKLLKIRSTYLDVHTKHTLSATAAQGEMHCGISSCPKSTQVMLPKKIFYKIGRANAIEAYCVFGCFKIGTDFEILLNPNDIFFYEMSQRQLDSSGVSGGDQLRLHIHEFWDVPVQHIFAILCGQKAELGWLDGLKHLSRKVFCF